MTSTERRKERNRRWLERCGIKQGDRITVIRDNGDTLRTTALCDPWGTERGGAYIRVAEIPGNTALRRVKKGWGKLDVLP